jgi:multiple sugar transport system ATP-binding protein
MAMADRLAVVHQGKTVQVGKPLEIYYSPANELVARFVGDPPMNFFDCAVVSDQDGPAIRLADRAMRLRGGHAAAVSQLKGGHVRVGVRPGDILLPRGEEAAGGDTILAEVRVVEPSERTVVVSLRANGVDFKLKGSADSIISRGDRLEVRFDTSKLYLFDPASGLALGKAAQSA